MRKKLLLCGLACLALSACQSVLGFETSPADQVQVPGGLFDIFEHPQRDRIMTRPTGSGILTASYSGEDASEHQDAARRYLDSTGRSRCPIVFIRQISGPQFEFRFNCLP